MVMIEINKIYCMDCLEGMKEIDDSSIDAVVTDPPYGLEFMGADWDTFKSTKNTIEENNDNPYYRSGIRHGIYKEGALIEFQKFTFKWSTEALRILKPGGHLLSFGGTRTYHRMACGIEDAGFEVRDMIEWLYGSGFPKSLDISKKLDEMKGAEREVIGYRESPSKKNAEKVSEWGYKSDDIPIDKPSTSEAKEWYGWGTALKPAHEPIVLARKPLSEKTITENVLKWGTGGLNIDECRIPLNGDYKCKANGRPSLTGLGDNYDSQNANEADIIGRFPANLIHDGSDEVTGLFPNSKSSGGSGEASMGALGKSKYGKYALNVKGANLGGLGDSGSASRFFYTAKASKDEKGEDNKHPTVKPVDLMKYLVKLVTRKKQIVLDPFMGSGTTAIACMLLQRNFIGFEISKEYYDIAQSRLQSPEIELDIQHEKQKRTTIDKWMI